jgi:cytochrome c-type biogenesis protein CcmF
MTEIGHAALLVAAVFAVHTVAAACLSARRSWPALMVSARRSSQVTLGLVSLAIVLLVILLVKRDYQVRYVYQHVSSTLHPIYRLAALWAGQEGSLLLWLWFLSIFAFLLTQQGASWSRALEPYALAALGVIQAFSALLLCSVGNPFVLLPARAVEGMGLSPLLESPGMIYHPPTLLLGYAAYAIPFAYALAALLSGNLGDGWVRGLRRWNLLAWAILGVGILLGARWTYVGPGQGSYWAWTPAEIASLVPWLTGTAFLHSAMIQERRGLFRVWNLMLAAATFLLCVLASTVTRGGPALGGSPTAYPLLACVGVILAVTLALIIRRRDELGSTATIGQVASRECAVLLANLLLTSLATALVLGTVVPPLAGALLRTPVALSPGFFDQVSRPVALVILLLLGIGPLLGWRRAGNLRLSLPLPIGAGLLTGLGLVLGAGVGDLFAVFAFSLIVFAMAGIAVEFGHGLRVWQEVSGASAWTALASLLRKSRRCYGGYLVHLAVVLMALGITGQSLYKVERQASLQRGEVLPVGPYQVRFEALSSQAIPGKERYVVTASVYLGDERVAVLRPERNLHHNVGQHVSEVAIHSTLREDICIAIADIAADGSAVTVRVVLNPLIMWLWIGGAGMLFGTGVALWPERPRVPGAAALAARRAAS